MFNFLAYSGEIVFIWGLLLSGAFAVFVGHRLSLKPNAPQNQSPTTGETNGSNTDSEGNRGPQEVNHGTSYGPSLASELTSAPSSIAFFSFLGVATGSVPLTSIMMQVPEDFKLNLVWAGFAGYCVGCAAAAAITFFCVAISFHKKLSFHRKRGLRINYSSIAAVGNWIVRGPAYANKECDKRISEAELDSGLDWEDTERRLYSLAPYAQRLFDEAEEFAKSIRDWTSIPEQLTEEDCRSRISRLLKVIRDCFQVHAASTFGETRSIVNIMVPMAPDQYFERYHAGLEYVRFHNSEWELREVLVPVADSHEGIGSPYALPIWADQGKKPLPGATECFIQRKPVFLQTTNVETDDYDPWMRNELAEYWSKRGFKHLLSFPIVDSKNLCFAILNIETDLPNMLGEKGVSKHGDTSARRGKLGLEMSEEERWERSVILALSLREYFKPHLVVLADLLERRRDVCNG